MSGGAELIQVRLVETESGQRFALALQCVGRVSLSVRRGDALGPGTSIGNVDQLKRRRPLRLPAGTPLLRVEALEVRGHQTSVAFGELLLEAVPLDDDVLVGAGAASGASEDADFVFRAPMSGQFYRQASPEEPAFASPGDVVKVGAQLGLVEVMKFFYPLELAAEEGAVEEGSLELVRFLIADGASINAGDAVAEFRRV